MLCSAISLYFLISVGQTSSGDSVLYGIEPRHVGDGNLRGLRGHSREYFPRPGVSGERPYLDEGSPTATPSTSLPSHVAAR